MSKDMVVRVNNKSVAPDEIHSEVALKVCRTQDEVECAHIIPTDAWPLDCLEKHARQGILCHLEAQEEAPLSSIVYEEGKADIADIQLVWDSGRWRTYLLRGEFPDLEQFGVYL